MRIFLQQVASGRFLAENGLWTEHQGDAKEFAYFLDALVFARDHVAEPVGAYCAFQDPSYNFSVYLRDNSAAAAWQAVAKQTESWDQAASGVESRSWITPEPSVAGPEQFDPRRPNHRA